jgi:starch phosphorylase
MAASQRLSKTGLDPGLDPEAAAFAEEIFKRLTYSCGKAPEDAVDNDWLQAVSLAVRDRIVDRWLASDKREKINRKKHVYYLSVEFLVGRMLLDALTNLQMQDTARNALATFNVDLDLLRKLEPDAALGNGGLGRLAACYMDSMSALGIPAYGYGIRYEQGLFRQQFSDGRQVELPDDWLTLGNPWEFARPETEYSIRFGGSVEYVGGSTDTARGIWYPDERVLAVAYDTPFVGWRGHHVNPLRLWSARATDPVHLNIFNQGDVVGATAARARAEAISRVLYPSDATPSGQELRLRQEYFFTSASLQDIVQRHVQRFGDLTTLADFASIQLNDTHPAIAVAELMRILVDEHDFSWEQAWKITTSTLSYTNHTLLPEALETWSTSLLGRLLPRHLQIIYLINWHHLKNARERGLEDAARLAAISLIQEDGDKRVRMGNLAFVGSHRVNGVSALHTQLMKETVFRDLSALYPDRVVNKTNGITFRRWLYEANPGLTALLVKHLGPAVLDDPTRLQELEGLKDNQDFVDAAIVVRLANKTRLAKRIRETTGYIVNPSALFDVQIKRIHEYKRQLLNILETVALYNAIRAEPDRLRASRVKLFAGKAAASYDRAKLIIKLINDVARVVNNDPIVGNRLKVVFIPNYGVSLAEEIIAGSDLSEQISTAGMEASGTGNMKLALNGALTIGTMDGANVEIRSAVGEDNIFIFGMTAEQVAARKAEHYPGRHAVQQSLCLEGALDAIATGQFSPEDPTRYYSLIQAIHGYDPFMIAADFDSYWEKQREIDALWQDCEGWWRMSILNTARMGWFSSDRAIREYAKDIWKVDVQAYPK